MAARGRKPSTDQDKLARGTLKPSAALLEKLNGDPSDIPDMADYLSAPARDVWAREIEHIIAAGARKADSAYINQTVSMLAEYELATKAYQSGQEGASPPSAATATELRVRLEGLGMAGAKSRIAQINKGGTTSAVKVNPFQRNGNRS